VKCSVCKKPAIIKLRAHNVSFCEKCLQDFVKRRVREAINNFKMITKDDKILVAVSGGKDSLAVWEILHNMGYDVDGFHIDLGIDSYSELSTEKSIEFSKKLDRKLIIADVRDHFDGKNIFEIAKKAGRVTCSVCGLIKRYLMNSSAYKGGYTVLVTGHNLDDESAALFGNLMFWRDNYLASQYPVLPATDPKLIRKVKPLIYLTEREIAAYNIVKGIDYIYDECPFAEGATSIFMKKELNNIEKKSPGMKLKLLKGFFRRHDVFKELSENSNNLETNHYCSVCGFPTMADDKCAYCRLIDKVKG